MIHVVIVTDSPSQKDIRAGGTAMSAHDCADAICIRSNVLRNFGNETRIHNLSVWNHYIVDAEKERYVNSKKGEASASFKNLAFNVNATLNRYLSDNARDGDQVMVFTIGSHASWAILGHKFREVSTKYRGSFYKKYTDRGVMYGVMPIIHPRKAWAKYEWLTLIKADIRKASYMIAAGGVQEPVLHTHPTFEQAIEYIKLAQTKNMVGFDIETDKQYMVNCFSIAVSANESMSIPLTYLNSKHYFTHEQEVDVLIELAKLLQNKDIVKLVHNSMFDATKMAEQYSIIVRNIEDTMIMQGLWSPDLPKNLATFTSLWTDIPYYKDDGKLVIRGTLKSQEELYNRQDEFDRYSALDALVLMRGYPRIKRALTTIGNHDTFIRQNAIIPVLLAMGYRGLAYDQERADAWANEETIKVAQMKDEFIGVLRNLLGDPKFEINLASPAQVSDLLYNKLRLPVKLGVTGSPSTDEKAIKQLVPLFPQASMLLEIRETEKLIGTYLKAKTAPDGRMRCSMNPIGTITGRLSSSKRLEGYGMNMQNQPRGNKVLFKVDAGYIGFSLDLAQAENRLVAFSSRDDRMMDAFSKGLDIHSATAALIFGGEPTKKAQSVLATNLGDGKKTQRDYGKRTNHGLNYGLGPKKFAMYIGSSYEDALFLHKKYHTAYPGVHRWHKMIEAELYQKGFVENLFGRRHRPHGRVEDSLTQSYSFIPQSSIADILILDAELFIYNNQDIFEPVFICNQVHDSIEFQVRLDVGFDRIAEIVNRISQEMSRQRSFYPGEFFTIPVDVKVCAKNFKDGTELEIITAETLEKAWLAEMN